MFDIKWIRDNADAFDEGLKRRGLEAQAAEIIALDDKRRACLTALQDAQSRRNAASKEIGKAKAAKDDATVSKLMGEVAELKDRIAKGEDEERKLDAEIRETLEVIPNLPRADVPDGADEKSNVEVRKVGTPRKIRFRTEAAFRDRRSAGADGLRGGAEDFGRALRRAERRAGAPRTRHRQLHARSAHGRVRLHGSQPAAARQGSSRLRHRQSAEVCRRSFQDDEWFLAHPDRRSVADEPRARVDHRGSATADAVDGVDAVLPLRSGCGRQRHARHDPPAPVLEGRTRVDHDAGANHSTSTSA